jgi:hypothetical protein
MANTEQAEAAAESIWAVLRPKEQREHLEEYIVLRAFFLTMNGDTPPEYVDAEEE